MTMKGALIPLAVFGLGGLIPDAASAAAPAYCALYARQYAVYTVQPRAAPGMLQSLEDQAYYRCLNQDEDPPLPNTSSYLGANITSNRAPEQADAPQGDKPVRTSTQKTTGLAVVNVSEPASTPAYRGSGLLPWTPEWEAWCAKHFPKSWDPTTGMIVHGSNGQREICK